jgi:hypothetical protein
MRARAIAFAWITSLLFAGLFALLTESRAFAQQPSTAPDPVTEVARQRYEEGVKAFDAGRYEEARSAFLQAYALKRHPAVLLNLGLSELRSGKYVEDGGNHLQQFVREHTAATPEQKASAEKAIADAKKRTAWVVVSVDAAGADVSIDGTALGKSPLLDPHFVKPGKHTLLASLQGKSATTQVDAKAGAATPANLNLGVGSAPPVAGVVPPGGAAAAPPSTAPAPPPSGPPGGGYQPTPSGGQMSFGASTNGPDTGGGEREPFFSWYGRKPLAWVGTGVAGVGLILGLTGSIIALDASSSADNNAGQIQDEADRRGIEEPCGPVDSGGERDVEGFRDACNILRDDFSKYDTGVAVAVTGWVLLGVGVVGTVTYAMVDWYPKKKPASTTGTLEIAPIVSPSYRGIGAVGTF